MGLNSIFLNGNKCPANRGKGKKFLLRLACLFELWDYKSEAEPRGSMTATSYGNNFCFQFLQHRLIALLRILSIFWEGGGLGVGKKCPTPPPPPSQ